MRTSLQYGREALLDKGYGQEEEEEHADAEQLPPPTGWQIFNILPKMTIIAFLAILVSLMLICGYVGTTDRLTSKYCDQKYVSKTMDFLGGLTIGVFILVTWSLVCGIASSGYIRSLLFSRRSCILGILRMVLGIFGQRILLLIYWVVFVLTLILMPFVANFCLLVAGSYELCNIMGEGMKDLVDYINEMLLKHDAKTLDYYLGIDNLHDHIFEVCEDLKDLRWMSTCVCIGVVCLILSITLMISIHSRNIGRLQVEAFWRRHRGRVQDERDRSVRSAQAVVNL
uniref:Uncharacterized protein n=1 Tax=Chromera velia CCMP2878 TaxID=1169474 RepID=A0A0G4G429_9ALVE|eukprot:Cvel_20197.t1-p1 / transcript=Cvel_20197.t1 / gene=Cvel_20197 / organism=Chromera_velia_CCMP2878 / gene_product=hypothetical protein / transcript_product=hypothetical protein / location=Cvel_scaffold1796:27987-29351(+) / protein_length=283 / sequence_SO=supercontig / SO=protein_coding / is_pseudo=false